MAAAGFTEADGNLSLSMSADLAQLQATLTAVQSYRDEALQRKVSKEEQVREEFVAQQKKKRLEDEARKAAIKSKICGQRKEEKEMQQSVSQHKGFGNGSKESASQLGAAGDDKGGG